MASIPQCVEDKLSTDSKVPSFKEWLGERLTGEHRALYNQLVKSQYDHTDLFPIDFDVLSNHAGFEGRRNAETKLLEKFVEDVDFVTKGNDLATQKYSLTLHGAQRFILVADTAGRTLQNFFEKSIKAVHDYELLLIVVSERHRSMEDRHKLLLQQNPPGTKITYIVDLGFINGVHYVKVGSTDDPAGRFGSLVSALTVPPNSLHFLDIIPSPNNRDVEKAFHKESKDHRAILTIKGKSQNEVYPVTNLFNIDHIAKRLRKLTKGCVADKEAQRNHVETKLKLQIDLTERNRDIFRDLIAAGFTGVELKDMLVTLLPTQGAIEDLEGEDTLTDSDSDDTQGDVNPVTSVTVVVNHLDLPKRFIAENLTRQLAGGLPAKTCAIESNVAVSRFKKWYKETKGTGDPPKTVLDKLKQSLGKVCDTTVSRKAWMDVVGYEPPPNKTTKRIKIYAFYGWRWNGKFGNANPSTSQYGRDDPTDGVVPTV